ncbi:LUD domain-containing protein [candidate division KSB1 bacterium]|nr:LUD domain-containing protein [candidate division KSB1 bacterium]
MESRTHILQNIKQSLETPSQLPDDPEFVEKRIKEKLEAHTPATAESLTDLFQSELQNVAGEFIAVSTDKEAASIIENIIRESGATTVAYAGSGRAQSVLTLLADNCTIIRPEQLDAPDKVATVAALAITIVDIDYAIADSGTLAILFNKTTSTLPYYLPEIVIALVWRDQLVRHHFELFEKIKESAKNMLLFTGPSRTADIEKILILGAHGPRRLIVIFRDEK